MDRHGVPRRSSRLRSGPVSPEAGIRFRIRLYCRTARLSTKYPIVRHRRNQPERQLTATRRPSPDRTIATEFSARLIRNGTAPPDTGISAQALHQTIRTLRDSFPLTPTHWSAHTHTGI